jgi:hypothetical protein
MLQGKCGRIGIINNYEGPLILVIPLPHATSLMIESISSLFTPFCSANKIVSAKPCKFKPSK